MLLDEVSADEVSSLAQAKYAASSVATHARAERSARTARTPWRAGVGPATRPEDTEPSRDQGKKADSGRHHLCHPPGGHVAQ
ncbi:MAG: hypothetical protein M3R66_08265 [Actinomycetota bacterium]|nr:hypothetical protein [Actinomycetota bacterium]